MQIPETRCDVEFLWIDNGYFALSQSAAERSMAATSVPPVSKVLTKKKAPRQPIKRPEKAGSTFRKRTPFRSRASRKDAEKTFLRAAMPWNNMPGWLRLRARAFPVIRSTPIATSTAPSPMLKNTRRRIVKSSWSG